MSMQDPIADMFTRIRNGFSAHKETISIPFSKMKMEIAKTHQSRTYKKNTKINNISTIPTIIKSNNRQKIKHLKNNTKSQTCKKNIKRCNNFKNLKEYQETSLERFEQIIFINLVFFWNPNFCQFWKRRAPTNPADPSNLGYEINTYPIKKHKMVIWYIFETLRKQNSTTGTPRSQKPRNPKTKKPRN